MTNRSLSISFSNRPNLTDGLILEQEEWAGGTGILTKLDLVKSLSAVLYGTEEDISDIKCGVDEGGSYLSGLYVYFYKGRIPYDIGITHGDDLGEPIIQEVEVRELVSFSLETEKNCKYPIHSIESYEWGADTWDSSGSVISNPAISVEGNSVKISKKVYGTVIIIYRTIRDAYHLTVPPRDETFEGVYDSYAWARWDGGVKLLKLDPPPNAEEAYLESSPCLWTSIGKVPPDDDKNPPPKVDGVNTNIRVDYCTQTTYEFYV